MLSFYEAMPYFFFSFPLLTVIYFYRLICKRYGHVRPGKANRG